MGKRILVPVDGSQRARAACEFAFTEFPDADFTLLHVINPAEAGYSAQASIPTFSEEWYDDAKEQAQDLFADLSDVAGDHGVTVETDTVVGKPASAIVEYADDEGFEQILMGSHGRSGVTRMLLGSVAENVVRNASVPVTVAR
jgi:nucleotide-binding universal stress UspA family protein